MGINKSILLCGLVFNLFTLSLPLWSQELYFQSLNELKTIAAKNNENITLILVEKISNIISNGVKEKFKNSEHDIYSLKDESVIATDSKRNATIGNEKYVLFQYTKESISEFHIQIRIIENKKVRIAFVDRLRKMYWSIDMDNDGVKYKVGEETLGEF